MIAPGRALEPVGRVLDVALLHVHEARTSQLPRHKPKANGLGADLAGQVEVVGKNVTRFRPGDEVFGKVNGEVPGKPLLELASFGEYVCVSEDWLALKPANLTFEQAAAVPMAGVTALQGLCDKRQIQPGQKSLINGAGGGVGTFAVQIAKYFGAEVTGVDSTRKLDISPLILAQRDPSDGSRADQSHVDGARTAPVPRATVETRDGGIGSSVCVSKSRKRSVKDAGRACGGGTTEKATLLTP